MMEEHFDLFRQGIIGLNKEIPSPDGETKRIVYADWTASGRNYEPIERRITEELMPLVGNTHTETSATGMAMTHAYLTARQIIKEHVNADSKDIIITAGSGMTSLVNKLQRILNLRLPEKYFHLPPSNERPVVFVTHMEHHSNQTSWLETIAHVEIINATEDGLVDVVHLQDLVDQYRDRELKIASVTACSNVTGIQTPYHDIARIMHKAGGYCFVDFACSGPYVDIDMHPADEEARLDAVFLSPHKFLGGPGSTGVMVFNSVLYDRKIPDNPGGGTVEWTNPWGVHKFIDDIESREDGGTPAFLQTIKTALCVRLKEEMGTDLIMEREHHLLSILWDKIDELPNLHILARQHKERLPIVSFYIDDLHYNLAVRILNDKFGIQSRGGCSCAGTYGHYLLNVDQDKSNEIVGQIKLGDFSSKPGWVRVSLHPTMTDEEVHYIADCIVELAARHTVWSAEYSYDFACGGETTKDESVDYQLKSAVTNSLTSPLVKKPVEKVKV
ncbi:MAG: aminotransferase class V-fold PLP-dependent enzyme [Bacteroidota bacterium]